MRYKGMTKAKRVIHSINRVLNGVVQPCKDCVTHENSSHP